MPLNCVGMCGERRFIKTALWPRFVVEMAIAIYPTHEGCGIANLELPYIRRDVADRQSDAPIIRPVELRSMHKL